jgi:hypothetical protein
VDYSRLPGYALVAQGMADLAAGRESEAALLVLIGAPRLRGLGFAIPDSPTDDPNIRLWQLLAADDSDSAHGRYNALVRELVSFERAAECAR